jgi:hypothetical protein
MANLSNTTRDHDVIRKWAEERGGTPSHVKSTGSGEDVGILRIDFPGYSGADSLEPISWDQWFEKFDEGHLAFLYEEQTAGGERSNFNKIISEETAEESEERKAKKAAPKKAFTSGNRAPVKKIATKAAAKKTPSKAAAKKTVSKKAAPNKAAAKKAVAKKPVARKAAPKKATAKKAMAKKAMAKKAAPKKAAAKKAAKKRR